MSEKKPVDWDAVERDYRAGILSLAEIGTLHGVTKGRISQVAKQREWERDLSIRIQAKAEAKLNAAAVNAELNEPGRRLAEREIIEANAERIAQVRGEHRSDISRGRNLCMALLGELESVTGNLELFQQLGELMADPEAKTDKLSEAYHKVIGIGGRVSSVKALSEAMRNFIALEREAYSIGKEAEPTADPTGGDPLEIVRRMAFALLSVEKSA